MRQHTKFLVVSGVLVALFFITQLQIVKDSLQHVSPTNGTSTEYNAFVEKWTKSTCDGKLASKEKPHTVFFLHIPKAGGSAFLLRMIYFLLGPRVSAPKKDCYNVPESLTNQQTTPCTEADFVTIHQPQSRRCRRVRFPSSDSCAFI
jgi:hypothetical protein